MQCRSILIPALERGMAIFPVKNCCGGRGRDHLSDGPTLANPMLDKLRAHATRHPHWTLALITLAALLPFLAKPFNIDDPLFLWAAKQIHAHPGDPYGFNVEWGFKEFPMARVTENPPLACYYLALAAGIFGWSEAGLHFAFMLPAIMVILGTHRLARQLCRSPGLAALATLFTPVFLVSASTVMCDVLMLAFWIWAVALWVEGMEGNSFGKLAGAGVLVSLAVVSKYYGVCLVPLLAAHGFILRRRLGRWAFALLIPIATICIYQLATSSLYGAGLLGAAGTYAKFATHYYGVTKLNALVTALTFTGGCVATASFFFPLLWWRTRALIISTAIAGMLVVLGAGLVLPKYPALESRALVEIQFVFWALGGLSILAMAVAEVRRRPDAQSWLLTLWVWGTFVFAAVINWTINGRSILPLAPAVAILIMRRLEHRPPTRLKPIALCLTAGAALSFIVAAGDYSFSRSVRQLSENVSAKYHRPAEPLWFQGHWGFQYYLQQFGGSPVDFQSSPLKPGDILVVPSNNTNLRPPAPTKSALIETITANGSFPIATMEQASGAGFYSSVWGPLPFAFGHVPPEYVRVYELRRPSVATPQNPK
jgi:4-amino-4-deoxy-L-arabinose transferase-like glycosyltransferase